MATIICHHNNYNDLTFVVTLCSCMPSYCMYMYVYRKSIRLHLVSSEKTGNNDYDNALYHSYLESCNCDYDTGSTIYILKL